MTDLARPSDGSWPQDTVDQRRTVPNEPIIAEGVPFQAMDSSQEMLLPSPTGLRTRQKASTKHSPKTPQQTLHCANILPCHEQEKNHRLKPKSKPKLDRSPNSNLTPASFFTNLQADLNGDESMKEVCSNSRGAALRSFIVFHLPAVSTTLFLLSLYLVKYRWSPSHSTSDEMGALLFAAKVHEMFILSSLADILLHRIRWGLLCGPGIALGFLPSPFHMSFSFHYLISWEFWAAALNPTTERRFHINTAATIVVLALLGLGAGPFSAIAMIPRLAWLDVPESRIPGGWRAFGAPEDYSLVYFIKGDPTPMQLGSRELLQDGSCDPEVKDTTLGSCMNPAITSMYVPLEKVVYDPPTMPLVANVSVPLSAGSPYERQISISCGKNNKYSKSWAYATTPMNFVTRVAFSASTTAFGGSEHRNEDHLAKFKSVTLNKEEKWKQPLVVVRCSSGSVSMENATFLFEEENGSVPPLNFTLRFDDPFQRHLQVMRALGHTNATAYFLNLQEVKGVPISAGIAFVWPSLHTLGMKLCLVHAGYVEADLWVERQPPLQVRSHPEVAPSDALHYFANLRPEDSIDMKIEWLRGIGVSLNETRVVSGNPAYLGAWNWCGWDSGSSSCLPVVLSSYLVDALSRSKDGALYRAKDHHDYHDNYDIRRYPDRTYFTMAYLEHVYAYDFRNSTTILLAFAGLLLHLCLALLHLVLTTCMRNPWHSTAWGDFGQLMALALRSRPPAGLQNVGAGAHSSQTWKLAAVVREVGHDKRLEMVLRDGPASGEASAEDEGLVIKGEKVAVPGQKYR